MAIIAPTASGLDSHACGWRLTHNLECTPIEDCPLGPPPDGDHGAPGPVMHPTVSHPPDASQGATPDCSAHLTHSQETQALPGMTQSSSGDSSTHAEASVGTNASPQTSEVFLERISHYAVTMPLSHLPTQASHADVEHLVIPV
ncbi:hypothetical protein JB92DRAFT_2824661 [Gautieria morchelliformis]|nr:hypothetical protein JB92DRAFT_2824661 [Gautieria morchelliformis]